VKVSVTVTWSDGSTTRHVVRGLPGYPPAAIEELVEKELVDWLDPDELPDDAGGGAMAWVAVRVTRMQPEGGREVD
jgi:hypothetical protein